jgi:NIMA (never in mitosis gene a)-related kinase
MSLNDFELIKELGKGAFANVWLVRRKADNLHYAMKRISLKTATLKNKENALNEIRLLASITHPNIIDYKESFYDEETMTLNIIMECADDGDLQNKINKYKTAKTYIPEKDIWSYLAQILMGLKALHDHKIIHRDLKTANVFITKQGHIKLGDLNVSKELENGFLVTQTGTPYYASPEVWSERPYDYKSDIWSLGCIIYELCALKLPFRGKNIDQLFKSILSGVYETIPNYYSKDLHTVIAQMLKLDPIKRPNCESLIAHPIIAKKITSQIENGQTPLLDKIKWPNDEFKRLNSILPKVRRYSSIVVSAARPSSKERASSKAPVAKNSTKENYYHQNENNVRLYNSNSNSNENNKDSKVKILTLFNKKVEDNLTKNKECNNNKISKSPVRYNDRYNHLDRNRKSSMSKVSKINPTNILVFLNKYGYNNNSSKQKLIK